MYKCTICGEEFEKVKLSDAFTHVIHRHGIELKDVKYVLVPRIPARLSSNEII